MSEIQIDCEDTLKNASMLCELTEEMSILHSTLDDAMGGLMSCWRGDSAALFMKRWEERDCALLKSVAKAQECAGTLDRITRIFIETEDVGKELFNR